MTTTVTHCKICIFLNYIHNKEDRTPTMASRRPPSSRSAARGNAAGDSAVPPESIAPLIPQRLAYTYNRTKMLQHYNELLAISKKHRVGYDEKPKLYLTADLVDLICLLRGLNLSEAEHAKCEQAAQECLAVREHNAAFLTHSMFVTMVGMVVARALEQANVDSASDEDERWIDLLLDRYYARRLATHDSSKTSAVETTAYAGIMSFFMEKRQSEAQGLKKCPHHRHIDEDTVLTIMANHGLHHHYTVNSHHPEHNNGASMSNMDVIEAVVDGLACMLERRTQIDTSAKWIEGYYVTRFSAGPNQDFAKCILNALKVYITDDDFNALVQFRRSVHAITGAFVPWDKVVVTNPVPRVDEATPQKKRSPRVKL